MNAFTFGDQAFLASIKSSFSPMSFPGLEGWLKADSFTDLPDGGIVGQAGHEWIDQSTHAHNAFAASGNPTWESNEVGTKPIVRFPGGGTFLNIPEIVFPGDLTVIFICKIAVGADTLCFGHQTLNHQLRRNTFGNDASFYDGATFITSSAFVGASSALQMLTYRRLAGTVSWRQNKTARGTGVAAATARFDSICNNIFLATGNMDIGEIVFYTDNKTDVDCDNLYDNYFKPRWVTLP